MSLSTYFAPHYFAASYFGAFQNRRDAGASSAQLSDRRVYEALVAQLRSARLFERVDFPYPKLPGPLPPGRPYASLIPGSWSEQPDPRGRLATRTLEFTVSLVLNLHELAKAYERLDHLGTQVQNLLETTHLTGLVEAGRSRVTKGTWIHDPKAGGIRLTLDGRIAYLVDRSLPLLGG
ncbi:MAG: hypothetical protein KatS3mg108_0526 [Isosphaeraceae bacterium]|jgi:hypothetical protein|nr:MAG: hypothetical protein KatS3mg108_0526 [Isosphaeraceae bacterium]